MALGCLPVLAKLLMLPGHFRVLSLAILILPWDSKVSQFWSNNMTLMKYHHHYHMIYHMVTSPEKVTHYVCTGQNDPIRIPKEYLFASTRLRRPCGHQIKLLSWKFHCIQPMTLKIACPYPILKSQGLCHPALWFVPLKIAYPKASGPFFSTPLCCNSDQASLKNQ